MVDDLAGVSEHKVNAKQLNAFINVKTAEKKLQFGPDKCHTLTISHKSEAIAHEDLHIDVWTEKQLIDTYAGKVLMKNISKHKYFGFAISKDV